MQKMMMLGLVCLTLLGSQAVLAQNTTPNDENAAVAGPRLTGKMIRKFAGDGKKKYTNLIDTFQSASVRYDKVAEEWSIFTKARNHKWRAGKSWNMWIKYHEPSGLLVISTTKENGNQWYLKNDPRVNVTIDGGKSGGDKNSFRLDFINTIGGTNKAGRHFNWWKGSWLLATR